MVVASSDTTDASGTPDTPVVLVCVIGVAFRYRYHHGTRDGSLRGQYPGG